MKKLPILVVSPTINLNVIGVIIIILALGIIAFAFAHKIYSSVVLSLLPLAFLAAFKLMTKGGQNEIKFYEDYIDNGYEKFPSKDLKACVPYENDILLFFANDKGFKIDGEVFDDEKKAQLMAEFEKIILKNNRNSSD
jgi:hypothetical protein